MDSSVGVKYADYGCKHYKRKCSLYGPCCGKVYMCRLCHDDVEDHEMNRKKVEVIKCNVCSLLQAVKAKCSRCSVEFGAYFCPECRLYDDDTSKDQFHCDPCGICRIGGMNNFVHCPTCDICVHIEIEKQGHKCVPQNSRKNCSICSKYMHSSTAPLQIGKCGHILHVACAKTLEAISESARRCPECNGEF